MSVISGIDNIKLVRGKKTHLNNQRFVLINGCKLELCGTATCRAIIHKHECLKCCKPRPFMNNPIEELKISIAHGDLLFDLL